MANENLLPEFENPKEENLLPEFEIKRKGALEKAIEPITSIPETYQKMVRGSVEQMGRGIEQISGALEQPTIPSGAWEAAKGIGNIALGGLGYVTAPISTPFHTIVGEPIRENVEPYVGPEAAQVIGATAEGLAGLAIPTKVPQFRTAPRLPPEEPFGITRTLGERTDNIGMRAEEAAAIRSGEPYAAEFAAQRQAQIDAAREGMIRQLDPYEQQIIALTPREAGELASRSIIGEATQARTNVNSLYTTAKNLPGEIHAGAFEGIGQKIKGDISLGDSPVIIDNTTPQAAKMINYLDDQISNLKIKNVADPFGAPSAENIVGVNLKGVDQWRRNLSAMRRDAFSSSPPGQISGDARAAQAVLDAFDERIASTINNPVIFTGDSRAVDAWNQARQAYADYRRTFTAQRNDPAGRAMQRIIGDPINDPLTPSKVIDSIIGATGVSASPTNIAVANRVRSVLGEGSPEWIAVKQTLLQRLIRPGEGEVDFGISRQAQNLSKFLNGDMARVMYTPAEQSMLRGYANLMRDLTLPTGTYAPSEPAIRRLQGALTQRIGGLVGSIIGHKIVPVPVVGELAGYAAGKQAEKLIAPTLKKNFPIISQEMRKWSEAQSRAMTQPQNTMAQRAAVSATINLQRALNPLGIKIDELVEPKKEESLLSSGGSVLDKMHAAKRRADGGPLDGPFDEAGVQRTAEGYPYIQAGDAVEAPETVAAPVPAPEEPRPGYLQKSIEGLTRGVRELPGTVARAAEDYWAKTKEEQKHGLEMAGRGLSNIAGGLPATGVGEVGLGALQYLASPITGIQKPIEKATGSPEFAERLMAIPLGPESLAAKTGIAMAGAGIGAKGVLGAMQAAKTERELSPLGFYSHGAEAATALPQAKGTPEQMRGMLERAGVKPAELEGFNEAFAGKPSITREEIAQHFRQAMPQVEEVVRKTENINPKDYYEYRMSREQGAERNYPSWSQLSQHERQTWSDAAARESIYKSGTKFDEYQLPGGENYREVLLKAPNQWDAPRATQKANDKRIAELRKEMHGTSGTNEIRSEISKLQNENIALQKQIREAPIFKSSHWDDPNVLAHLRMSDRTGPNGEKMLHVEEMQSDWGQKGRKEGFGTKLLDMPKMSADELLISHGNEMNNNQKQWLKNFISEWENANKKDGDINALIDKYDKWVEKEKLPGIPAAPYVTSTQGWTDLALKRVLKEAAEGGYDKVVFTPGAEQAARYDLSKHIDELHWNRGNLVAYDKNGNKVIQRTGMTKEELPDLVGKEVAERLLKQEPKDGWNSLIGENLSVGGEGMKSYYDKIVPTQINKLIGKYDKSAKAKLHDMELPTKEGGTTRGHVIEITPKMREAILAGQAAFARGGSVLHKMMEARRGQR